MTVSHLFFALAATGYILVGIQFEEADLTRQHPEYAVYRKQVPMLVPRIVRDVSIVPAAAGKHDTQPSSRVVPAS